MCSRVDENCIEVELKGVFTQRSMLMKIRPVDRLIEFGLGPELTYIADPAAVGPWLDINLVVPVIGPKPAFSDHVWKRVRKLGSRTVDHTMIMETAVFSTLKDGDHLDPLSVSAEAVTVDPFVKPVHEMSEISNRSIRSNPAVDRGPSVSDHNRLLQCQGD